MMREFNLLVASHTDSPLPCILIFPQQSVVVQEVSYESLSLFLRDQATDETDIVDGCWGDSLGYTRNFCFCNLEINQEINL